MPPDGKLQLKQVSDQILPHIASICLQVKAKTVIQSVPLSWTLGSLESTRAEGFPPVDVTAVF